MALEQSEAGKTPHQAAEDKVLGMFMAPEEVPAAPASNRPRNEQGKFVRTGPEETQETAEVETQEAEAGGEVTPQQPEEVEVDIEGEKYLVPKKISDRFIQHADYTRKTQDLAEMRRVAAAEREVATVESAFRQAVSQETQQLALLDAQIAQYSQVNWGQMETQDLLRTRAQLDQLKETRTSLAEQVKAKRGEFDQKIQTATQEALQAGQKYIEQHIKGFDQSQKRALMEYGLGEGYTRDELAKVIDPRIVVSLWKAQQWDSLQASKPGITNKAQQAAPVVRPGATQKQPSRVQALNNAFHTAKDGKAKRAAAEDYFAARFGGK